MKISNKRNNVVKAGNKTYSEVSLNGLGDGRFYKNPLTKAFQYEYALYMAVSELFASVRCRSMYIDSMKLYFSELPHAQEQGDEDKDENPTLEKKRTQEDLLAEMTVMVARDVVGHITFPMMSICQAEAHVVINEDGKHSFVFEDGIYGFSVKLDMAKKGKPKRIQVMDLGSIHPVKQNNDKKDKSRCVA